MEIIGREGVSVPVGFLWFYDTGFPTTAAIQNVVNTIKHEKGSWTGDELSDAVSRKWISCACKFLEYDGKRAHEKYELDLDGYAGSVRNEPERD